MTQIDQKAVVRRVFMRLMPVLFISYILAYIDRINVGFAAIHMNSDVGISPYVFGLGAGVFFFGYFLFEVPSNLMLEKVGARRWIARIMISWGLLSAAMALVQGATSFVALRFLLGVAEAGFFPGVILYLTYWFPQEYRARILAAFMVAIPVALAIGAPVSTLILQMDGIWGLKGWQWLFIIEGLPTTLFGFVFLSVMPDKPSQATWLKDDEKLWLQSTIDAEQDAVAATQRPTMWTALADRRVLILSFIYLTNTTANLGLAFFLPQILKDFGFSDMHTGLLTAVPYIFGTLGILIFGYVSDRFRERRWTLFAALALTGFGLVFSGVMNGSLLAVAFMSLAAIGIYGTKAPFWPIPSMFLTGSAAAAGIALINSIGNLGGFIGPYVVGYIREESKSFEAGLYFLGGLSLVSAALALVVVTAHFAEGRRKTTIREPQTYK